MIRLLLALLALLCAPRADAVTPADRIIVNARIWTGVDGAPLQQALAVRGDRLAAVGSNAAIRALRGPRTVVSDLGGRLVVPGFVDSHWHFTASERVDLDDAGSVEEIVRRLVAFAASHPSGCLVGRGWGYTDFPDRLPHRRHLDAAFPDRPVLIQERDGHMLLANSKALALAGIGRQTPDPPDGRIERDADGAPTGELKEAAMALVERLVPEPSAAEVARSLERLTSLAASYGITSIHSASQGLSPVEMEAFTGALDRGTLKVRFYVAVPFDKDASDADLRSYVALRDRYRGPVLKFGAAKGLLDGTVDARTAAMLEPYVGTDDTGIPMWTQEDLDRTAIRYDRAGLQILLHAIGDKAIRMALDAYERAARANGTQGRRHRIEHMEVPSLSDLPRLKALGVIASTQAMFAYPDATTLGNYAVLLGPARASHANAFKLVDDAGAVQAFGSDHPVFTMQVLKGIHTAVSRTTAEGTPAGGWYPANRIGVEAALRHFTRDGAYASFDEAEKGTLEAGKLADFVVLSRNILEEPPRILETAVLQTVMGGRETYRAPDAAWR
jgi:predicted amidohydrolase YtcJ